MSSKQGNSSVLLPTIHDWVQIMVLELGQNQVVSLHTGLVQKIVGTLFSLPYIQSHRN